MSGLNRNVMVAGLMAAMATPGLGATLSVRSTEPAPNISFFPESRNRGKGRNKSPRRFTGVAAAKRASIKARNRRKL
jgi:hypothetical protein